VVTEPLHWIHQPLPDLRPGSSVQCQFRFQHTHPLIDCLVSMNSDRSLNIHLSQPIRALTCGQYAVLYRGLECLGSAEITRVGPSLYNINREKSTKQKHNQASWWTVP